MMYNNRNKVSPREENSSPKMYVLKTEAYISLLLVTEEGAVKFAASKRFNQNLAENVITAMSCCTWMTKKSFVEYHETQL